MNSSKHYFERLPRYWVGSDVTKSPTERYAIDLFGLTKSEAFRDFAPLYQHLQNHVRPERLQNRDKRFREIWWEFGRPRPELRQSNEGLRRYIVTSEVSKYRTFVFLQWPEDLIDGSMVGISLSDGFYLGVLSSKIHTLWALAAGGRMGVGNDPRYTKTRCFDPFPFPDHSNLNAVKVRELAEQLDAHRKRRQTLHPKLTLTQMYNVLEKLRSGDILTVKERQIHDDGLVSVLKEIHDRLDDAVAAAYGWSADLSDDDILERLVDLNAERAEEEKHGVVRWLRPEFQSPGDNLKRPVKQESMSLAPATSDELKKRDWPQKLPEQVQAVRQALAEMARPVSAAQVARRFKRARTADVEQVLIALSELKHIRRLDEQQFAP